MTFIWFDCLDGARQLTGHTTRRSRRCLRGLFDGPDVADHLRPPVCSLGLDGQFFLPDDDGVMP
jgi:hypothetical protein